MYAAKTVLLVLGFALGRLASAQSEVVTQSWGMNARFGVNAVEAQKKVKLACQNSQVIVAIVDTGIDPSHPAIRNSLWTNTKELNGKTGTDDDGNGFVDDLHGFDFVTNKGILVDHHGHGSHIAGIISGNDQAPGGFKGVCPGIKIMPLRYYDEKGSGAANLKNTIRAIDYAVANGANIINYSGGGPERADLEYEALKRAQQKGILVVAAAGNERNNADKTFYYPAAYDLDNILAVTAIDAQGQILPSSNWGKNHVHVAAPGNAIISSIPNSNYGTLTGTSQATAFVSGVAAMLLTQNSKLSYTQLKNIIESSVVKKASLSAKTRSGGYVNAVAALAKLTPEVKAPGLKVAKRMRLAKSKARQAVARETADTASNTLQVYKVLQ
jgi:thermitase